MLAWSALLVAHRHLTTQLEAELREHSDMTLDDYDVLYQLRRAGSPMRMSELSEQVLISRPTTTRVVDRLVARGWVGRQVDEHDRRVVRVELTSAGRGAQRAAARRHMDGVARLFGARLDDRQAVQIALALESVVAGTPEPTGEQRGEPM
ncbi:MarR family transcriptional regulator [soil metagenome]